MDTVKYPRVKIGVSKAEGVIYLTPPRWECDWYWGWGYIGNQSYTSHLNHIDRYRNIYDAMKAYFTDIPLSDKDLWTFSELVTTFYALKKVAAIYNTGGSHYSTNPMAHILKDKDRCNHINQVLLPAIFVEAYKLFERKNDKET